MAMSQGLTRLSLGSLRSGWSAYDEVAIEYDKGPGDGTTVIEQNWEDVVDYKIGGFYTFTDYLKIRVVAITKQPVRFQRRHLVQRLQMVLGATVYFGELA